MRAQTRTVALMSDRDEDDDKAPDIVTMKFPGRDKPADRGPMIGPIEKGIPLPVQGGRRTNPITVALLETQPGDSIFFRGLERSKASGYAAAAREKMGKNVRFAARAIGDGTRVWRVS